MDHVMRNLAGVVTFIDDVLCYGRSHANQLEVLESALLRLRKYGLKLNMEKTILGASEVQYLGHTLNGDRFCPSKDKLEAIRNMRPPTTPRQVKEYIGLCNYFRFMIPGFHGKVSPLLRLTRMSSEWKKGTLPPPAMKAWEGLRQCLLSVPLVTHPRKGRQYVLQTDPSASDKNTDGG